MTVLAPAGEKLSIDNASSENVAEDLDYRIARRIESQVGWRAFLEAHPDGPHAQAARTEIDGLQSAPSSQPEQSRTPTQTPADAAQETASPAAPPQQSTSGSNLRRLRRRPRTTRRRPRRRRSWSRSSQRRRPRRPRSRSNSRRLLWRRRRPSRRRPRRRLRSWPRRSRRRRPSQLRSRRTRRCPRHDRAGSRPQSPSNRRIRVIRAPSAARPANRMF